MTTTTYESHVADFPELRNTVQEGDHSSGQSLINILLAAQLIQTTLNGSISDLLRLGAIDLDKANQDMINELQHLSELQDKLFNDKVLTNDEKALLARANIAYNHEQIYKKGKKKCETRYDKSGRPYKHYYYEQIATGKVKPLSDADKTRLSRELQTQEQIAQTKGQGVVTTCNGNNERATKSVEALAQVMQTLHANCNSLIDMIRNVANHVGR